MSSAPVLQLHRSIELYRGCSGGCECDTKEFIPVCVSDGPLQVTFFSPCHAGCYQPGETKPAGKELQVVEDSTKYYTNCRYGCLEYNVHTSVTELLEQII